MKRIFVFIILVFLACAHQQPTLLQTYSSPDYLIWSETRKLTWDDFKGTPIENSSLVTEIVIQNPSLIEQQNLISSPKFEAICFVNRNTSWAIKERVTDNLLKYNQTIFDIYELYTRKLKQSFAYAELNAFNSSEKYKILTEANYAELISKLKNFRSESKMGSEENIVDKWATKINSELEKLKIYKN